MALPDDDCSAHGEDRLDECADRHPHTSLASDLIADASDECTEDEGEDRTKCLSVGNAEGVVVLAIEEPCQGDCKLWKGSAG